MPCRENYGTLGLPAVDLEAHIAYDIGAADLTRRLAARLDAPALLTRFSRLLIDPNRGAQDPTLVMRLSDRRLIPGNARIDAAEIERRRALYWQPYRAAIAETIAALIGQGAESRRGFACIRSRQIGAARSGPGRSAFCGTPIRACRCR